MAIQSKAISEVITVTFDFTNQTLHGEAVSGALVSIEVFSGTDSTPSVIKLGNPVTAGYVVTQQIQQGLPGVIYNISCTLTGGTTKLYEMLQLLAVTTTKGSFALGTGLSITGTLPSNGCISVAYYQTLAIVDGYEPYGPVTISSGSMPVGLTATIVGHNIVISGIAGITEAVYNFTVRLVDFVGNVATSPQTITMINCSPTTYETLVLADNPIAWWKCDESGATTTAIDSIGTNNGTYSGNYTLAQVQLRVGGGLAPHFTAWPAGGTGNAGRVKVFATPTAYLDELTGFAFSVETWFKGDVNYGELGAVNSGTIFASAYDATFGYMNFNLYKTIFTTNIQSVSAAGTKTPSTINLVANGATNCIKNTIYHAIATYDGFYMRTYINGILDGISALDDNTQEFFSTTTGNLGGSYIGSATLPNGVSTSFNGYIGDVIVYRSCLTAANILARYNLGHL